MFNEVKEPHISSCSRVSVMLSSFVTLYLYVQQKDISTTNLREIEMNTFRK